MSNTKQAVSVNIKEAIKQKGLTISGVGEILFPGKRYTYLAMNRVISGNQKLDSTQVATLSKLLDIPIESLCQ